MAQNIKVIIGASYGDEGKGLATDYFGKNESGRTVNVLTNGGAQRGHTVELSDGTRHVFKHFGAASFRGASSYMAQQFIVNPIQFIREHDELKENGVRADVFVHPKCRFTTPWDMLINQKLKEKSGINNTCGFGVWETVLRYNRGYGIDFVRAAAMERDERITYLRNLRDGYFRTRMSELGLVPEKDDVFFSEGLLRHFEEDLMLMSALCHTAEYGLLRRYDTVLFENAQGLLLDGNRKGEEETTTPSTTGMGRIFQTIEDTFTDADVEVCYITRSYQTRHGAGKMEEEISKNDIKKILPGITADMTNLTNGFQGALRYGKLVEDTLIERTTGDMKHCSGRKRNVYSPSLLVTHMNEYSGIDAEKLSGAFKTVYLSDGRTAESVYVDSRR